MSEMAVLHNFSERENEKQEKKERGVCVTCTWGGEAWAQACLCSFFFFISEPADRVQRSDPMFLIVKPMGAGVLPQRDRKPLGGPCCYPRSKKGQTHRPTHAFSLWACTHLETGNPEKGNVRCTATCGIPAAGERQNVFNVAFSLAGLLLRLLPLFFHIIPCACVGSMKR